MRENRVLFKSPADSTLAKAKCEDLYAASTPSYVEPAQDLRASLRSLFRRRPRVFFSGDSFLYTSKEKSYPLLRRRSGSPGFKKGNKEQELDSRLRGNDEPWTYPLLRRRSGSSGSRNQRRPKAWRVTR